MRIGLDLDGTILLYDRLFHRLAVEHFGLPTAAAVDKTAVRDWLRSNAPGERGWIELQRLVYGLHMGDAEVAPGVDAFLRECRALGVSVSVISHKTRFSVAAPPVDLHAAARSRLEAGGFFDDDRLGLVRERVFFEPTRADKLRRIESEHCVLFVDDLEEVVSDPAFPDGVERWLYAPVARRPIAEARVFGAWSELSKRIHELRAAADDERRCADRR